jgi:hypothetical protein
MVGGERKDTQGHGCQGRKPGPCGMGMGSASSFSQSLVRINRRLFCRSTVPSALLSINHTVGSFADHLRGDVSNACSHSSPAVALLNQNELARRTMNVVWVVLRSTSFCFFHYIWGRREYMPALRPQRPSRPPPSPCSRTTQCRTTRTQRHHAHAVRAQSASCGSGRTPRLALYLTGKKETKTTNI